MTSLFPVTLSGRHVRLEPLAPAHAPLLLAAAAARASYTLTNVPADLGAMERYIEEALADAERGLAVPFAIVDSSREQVVGSTRFANFERWKWPQPPAEPSPFGVDAVEIGWTWLAERAQRTAINSEAKLLLLGHAFAHWRVRRVTLKTDARNARSRAAIDRIGGRLDGILRAHLPAWDGGVRDTAYFSLIADEWPTARRRLEERLQVPPRASGEPSATA